MNFIKGILKASGANANVLIRFVVGGVFLNEGILKFLYPAAQAAGRLALAAFWFKSEGKRAS